MAKRKDPEARAAYKDAWAKRKRDKLKAEEFARDPVAAAKRRERRMEQTDSPEVADAIAISTDPLVANFARAARECGLNKDLARRIKERLQKELLPVGMAVKEAKTSVLLNLTADRARRIIESVTQSDIDDASLRDKAVAFGILVEKRQLLSGEPTHLIGIQDRRHLGDLTKALMLEAQRRGITIDTSPIDGSVRCLDETPTPEMPMLHKRERRKIDP